MEILVTCKNDSFGIRMRIGYCPKRSSFISPCIFLSLSLFFPSLSRVCVKTSSYNTMLHRGLFITPDLHLGSAMMYYHMAAVHVIQPTHTALPCMKHPLLQPSNLTGSWLSCSIGILSNGYPKRLYCNMCMQMDTEIAECDLQTSTARFFLQISVSI